MKLISRRRFVTTGVLATAIGLAGCIDDDDDVDDDADGVQDDTVDDEEIDDEENDVDDDTVDDAEDDEEVDDEEDDTVDDDDIDDEEDDTVDDEENDVDDEEDDAEERVDSYLTENDAQLYEGDIEDLTGQDEATVDVGAGDDGLAFDPPAIRIDAGTTILWEWTGEGGGHNVVPDGESDFDDFGEEQIVDEAGHVAESTFDDAGVGLYVCEPHAGVGMNGAFVVE